MEERLRQLVHYLRCAVSQALADSEDVGKALQTIRQEGWSLYLVVDRKRVEEDLATYEVVAERPRFDADVAFRIDGSDLSFLRSIGIDPTRKVRPKRRLS
jgi:hypothetical protein